MYGLIDYLTSKHIIKKFAFFYQDDAFGRGALEAAHSALKAHGITKWIDIPYNRGATDLTEQAKMIIEAAPEAIGLLSTIQPTEELIRRIDITNLRGVQFFWSIDSLRKIISTVS